MQEKVIFDFLAYVWALGIVPTPNPASAGGKSLNPDPDETRLFDADAIKTETELRAALSDLETVAITLANDIITLEDLVVNRDDSIELNLNGFKIASLTENAKVIDVQAGDITILGLGSIVATGTNASAVRIRGAITADNVNYARVTIGADVTLYAPNSYGIFVTTKYNAAYGVTVNLHGSVIAHDGIGIHSNVQGRGDNIPHINIYDSAKIIADENEGSAICGFGSGIWEINAAELTGGTGLNLKSGALNLREVKLVATGDSDIFPGSGAAIRLEDSFAHRIELKIFGGSYLSVQNYAFYEQVERDKNISLRSLEVYDGIFSGQLGTCFGIAPRGSVNAAMCIYGGKFNADVSQYLAPEHHVEQDLAHNEFVVIDDTEPVQVIDKAAQLELAKTDLSETITIAKRYIKPSYAGKELGEIQATVNKIIGTIKRSIKSAEKLLVSSDLTLAKVKNSTRRLEDHLSEIRSIEDAMRAEISEAIDFSKIDQSQYTPDSFLDLSLAAADAEQLLATDSVTLVELQDMLGVIDAAKIMLEEADEYSIDLAGNENLELASASTPESMAVPDSSIFAPEVPTLAESGLPAPDLPLMPAPKLFSDLPTLSIDDDAEDIEEALADFVDPAEEWMEQPLVDSFDDELESEDVMEVKDFINQLMVAELITEPLPPELPTSALESDSNVQASEIQDPVASEFEPESEVLDMPAVEPTAPVFIDPELAATKQTLRDLLNAISTINPADYTVESYAILARTAGMAGNLLSENSPHTTTSVLISAANSVNVAYERLVKKADNPESVALKTVKLNLRSMLDAVQDLTVNDYEVSMAEQFGELQVAIAKAKSILMQELPSLPDVLNVMDEIKLKTSGLKNLAEPAPHESAISQIQPEPEPVLPKTSSVQVQQGPVSTALDWSELSEALNDIRALNASDYTAESYQKLINILESAKVLSSKLNLTQSEIDEVVFELNLAVLALERPVTPRLSGTQEFSNPIPTERVAISSADVGRINHSGTQSIPNLATDDSITPSLLMSMMAGAYAGLATYRRSRLEAKKRKQLRSA